MQLELSKQGSTFQLPIDKISSYVIKLFWNSKEDLDAGAIALEDGKIRNNYDRVLSTFNSLSNVYQDDQSSVIDRGTERPFQNRAGYLFHSGDLRESESSNDPEEVMEIKLSAIPADINEIQFNASIFNDDPANKKTEVFKVVSGAKIVIEDDTGKKIVEANLSEEFKEYDVVSFGSIKRNKFGWQFDSKSFGLNGGMNVLLSKMN